MGNNAAKELFAQTPKESRKDFALWALNNRKDMSSYLFALQNGRPLEPIVYKNAFVNRPNEAAVSHSQDVA